MLTIDSLSIGYTAGLSRIRVPIVEDVSLTIGRGESLGLVGESGSGKSTLGYAIAGALRGLEEQSGSIRFDKVDPCIGFVQQNAGQALTPTMKIRNLMREVFRYNGRNPTDAAVAELLDKVRLPDPENLLHRYPHELSGGQQQRVLIAQALARHPDILILDEPTTSLDASTRESLLELVAELQSELGFAMLLISHDLGVIRASCQRTAVMYGGALVEVGATEAIIAGGRHPYTRALIEALPSIEERVMPEAIEGAPPRPFEKPKGCPFSPRCKFKEPRCLDERPSLEPYAETGVACFRPLLGTRARPTPFVLKPHADGELLNVSKLNVTFQSRKHGEFHALRDVSLSLKRGEVLGIIGESGSGKSTLLRCLTGLQHVSSGDMRLAGADDLNNVIARRSSATQKRLQLVFQNPATALNPSQTISQILSAPFQLYRGKRPDASFLKDTLERVRLTENHLMKRPNELSGGEKQRVALARGLIATPDVLMLDEVTSALDVSVQAAVLNLLLEIRDQTDVSMIVVSHDIAVMRALSHRLIVLKDGQIVDQGPTDQIVEAPQSAYTKHLIESARALNA
ncbi:MULTISPECIES: ABC transporter ATP-binding protein [unclassified Phaeobacter]|uniref:ABC transporter ATP-binding protein n=1 Tax=unclassified Phaeobacter TaxID=2621772 RepID=UPI003A83DE81